MNIQHRKYWKVCLNVLELFFLIILVLTISSYWWKQYQEIDCDNEMSLKHINSIFWNGEIPKQITYQRIVRVCGKDPVYMILSKVPDATTYDNLPLMLGKYLYVNVNVQELEDVLSLVEKFGFSIGTVKAAWRRCNGALCIYGEQRGRPLLILYGGL